MSRPLLYICAPFASRTINEAMATDLAIEEAIAKGWAPFFVPYAFRGILDDLKPEHREAGLQCCAALVPRCEGFLIVGSRMTAGMNRDLASWTRTLTYTIETLPEARS